METFSSFDTSGLNSNSIGVLHGLNLADFLLMGGSQQRQPTNSKLTCLLKIPTAYGQIRFLSFFIVK